VTLHRLSTVRATEHEPKARLGETGLSLFLQLGDTSSACDLLETLGLVEFAAGRQPWARSKRIDRVRGDATLLPEGVEVIRHAVADGQRVHMATGDGWTLRAVRWRGGADVTVTAVEDDLARTILDQATENASESARPHDGTVPVGFWHRAAHGTPHRASRQITAAAWREIRSNYSERAAVQLDRLMAMSASALTGRLILLHGPPGTGKTTAVRSLAREWRRWCQLDCILDPERLFNDPTYLLEVAIGDDDKRGATKAEPRWRLLLLEDCDEFIGGGARQATGQALSRLLNLTDGLLGQGREVLVAITTNEDLNRLHPAVVRPGRCLAQVEFGRLPYEQAVAWLGTPAGIAQDGATLAALYALREGRAADQDQPDPVGLYL
jgi:Domain of unknown function (DUF5925)/ATPase family associated with various cellular activities (AAA)